MRQKPVFIYAPDHGYLSLPDFKYLKELVEGRNLLLKIPDITRNSQDKNEINDFKSLTSFESLDLDFKFSANFEQQYKNLIQNMTKYFYGYLIFPSEINSIQAFLFSFLEVFPTAFSRSEMQIITLLSKQPQISRNEALKLFQCLYTANKFLKCHNLGPEAVFAHSQLEKYFHIHRQPSKTILTLIPDFLRFWGVIFFCKLTAYYYDFRFQLSKIPSILQNIKTINHYLKFNLPDLVIVTSDLGNINKRIFLGLCEKKNIPILIYYTCDTTLHNQKRKGFAVVILRPLHKLAQLLKFKVLDILIDSRLYNRHVIGSLTNKSILTVTNFNTYQKYKTLLPNRIVHFVNNPKLPSEIPYTPSPRTRITYFTECIQDLAGLAYAKETIFSVIQIFKECSSSATFFIRFHPQEPIVMRDFVIELIKGSDITILNSPELTGEMVIAMSDLNIAHFSRILLTALYNDKDIISVNFLRNRQSTFIPQHLAATNEIYKYDDLLTTIKQYTSSPEFRIILRNNNELLKESLFHTQQQTAIKEIILKLIT
jgi:hypothetical protein